MTDGHPSHLPVIVAAWRILSTSAASSWASSTSAPAVAVSTAECISSSTSPNCKNSHAVADFHIWNRLQANDVILANSLFSVQRLLKHSISAMLSGHIHSHSVVACYSVDPAVAMPLRLLFIFCHSLKGWFNDGWINETRRRSESAYVRRVHDNVIMYTSTRLHTRLSSNVMTSSLQARCAVPVRKIHRKRCWHFCTFLLNPHFDLEPDYIIRKPIKRRF